MCVARLCLVLKDLAQTLHWIVPMLKWCASKCCLMLPLCRVILPQRKQDQEPRSEMPAYWPK